MEEKQQEENIADSFNQMIKTIGKLPKIVQIIVYAFLGLIGFKIIWALLKAIW